MEMDVTKENFDEIFPIFAAYLKESSFIAVDTEFTGVIQNCLGDDGAERYRKLKKHCQEITVCQVGICLFIEKEHGRRYEALPYSFHVFPRVVAGINRRFSIDASAAEFLAHNHFDFNKFIYRGIPYLNNNDVGKVRAYLTDYTSQQGTDRCSRQPDDDTERGYSEDIRNWLVSGVGGTEGGSCSSEAVKEGGVSGSEGDMGVAAGCLTLDVSEYRQPLILLHMCLRAKFVDIWTTQDAHRKHVMIVRRMTYKERKALEKQIPKEIDRCVVEMRGFSRVIHLMQQQGKPLVAHNGWTDLLLLYHHFYQHLPESYSDMKSCLHSVFPEVYDTKHIVYNVRKTEACHKPEVLVYDGLGPLYDKVKSSQGEVLASPLIKVSQMSKDMKEIPHDAAYDAYMCGCVFLQLSHLMTVYKNNSVNSGIIYRSYHYLGVNSPAMNRVNIIKAKIDHINLCGQDGEMKPIQSYLVAHKDSTQCVNMVELLQLYSNADAEFINESRSKAILTICSRKDCSQELQAAVTARRLPVTVSRLHQRGGRRILTSRLPWYLGGAIGASLVISAAAAIICYHTGAMGKFKIRTIFT